MSENIWTQERIDLVKRTVCPKGIGEDEFLLFMEQCRRSGLDPLLREAFCVPRRVKVSQKGEPDRWVTKHEFQPAESGMLTRAMRAPDFRGIQASAVFSEDTIEVDQGRGEVRHVFNPAKRDGKIVGAWARVVREGMLPFVVWLDFAAYVQPSPLWATKPTTMVEKCARVAALRKAYPAEFGGLYIAGERPDDVDGEEPEPAAVVEKEKPALPPPAPRETLIFSTAKEKVEARVGERERVVADVAREPGGDDGGPDALELEGAAIVAASEKAASLDELMPLKARTLALPKNSPEYKAAAAALTTAYGRLRQGAA